MVYANDQWIQLPTRDLYDTQIMAMAINAARDMYEKGQQEMKDFQKAYGDFLTPIMADQDWYNQNVTGRVRDAVNALYAQGIDPLRNAQGRAVISQLINNMPYGDIAKKRMRAKNAEEYYKNMAALRLNDKYNEDFSKWLGEDPNQWAPDSVGVTSPTVFKTLKDATDDWYNNRTPRDLTPEEKKQLGLDPRYKYTGYFDSDLMNVAKGQTPGWQGTPISNYYRELAKRKLQSAGVENPTAEQVEAVLQRDIANAQQEWLVGPTQGKADEFEVLKQQLNNTLAAQKQSKALDFYYKLRENGADLDGNGDISPQELQYYAMMKNAGSGGFSYDPITGNMISPGGQSIEFTDYRQMSSVENRNRRIQENAASYVQQMIDAEQANVDLYNKYLKENRTGKQEGEHRSGTFKVIGGAGMASSVSPYVNYEYTPTSPAKKHSEAEMKKLRTSARESQQKINIYKKYLNSDGSANYEKLIKAGYLNADGSPTEYFMREINKQNKISNSLPEEQRRERADNTYLMYAGDAPSPGSEMSKRMLSDAAGDNKVKVPGLPNEMIKVNLNHYSVSTIRRGNVTGANVYDKDSDVRKAQEWLRTNKVEGYVDDQSSVNDAWVPNAHGTRMENDVFFEALVDKRYINRMFADLGIKSKEQQDKLLQTLGIVPYEKQSTIQESTNSTDYQWITYYSIPVTKTYTSGIVQGNRNFEYRKAQHGQKNATENEMNSNAAGMQSTLIR